MCTLLGVDGGAGQEEGNPRTKLHDSGTAVLSSSLVMFTVISWPAKQSGMRSWVGTNHWPKSDPPESETTTQRHRQYTAKLSSLGVIFACHGCCCCYYLLPPPEQGTGNSLEQHTIHYLAIWPRITFTKDQRPCIRSWTRPDSIWVRLADGYVHIIFLYCWRWCQTGTIFMVISQALPSIAGVYITLRTHYATDRLGTIIRSS